MGPCHALPLGEVGPFLLRHVFVGSSSLPAYTAVDPVRYGRISATGHSNSLIFLEIGGSAWENGGMKTSFRPTCLFAFVCCAFTLLSISRPLVAAITVQTSDGRVLTGEVDEQTDERLLWIRQTKEQIVLTTSVAWSAITSVTDGGEILPLDQLPALLHGQANSEPMGFLVQRVAYYALSDCQGDCFPRHSTRRLLPSRPPQVQSLSVEAHLVNLDRDVEPDGLELVIAALDEHGVPVPVKGSLYIRLWGERIRSSGSLDRHEDLEQWTQPVMPADFIDGIASYAIRFRKSHPASDVGLHPEALLNVRLGVFGQGNFSASVPVQIRAFNPFRDRLQLNRGTRYFPGEVTQESQTRTRRFSSTH